MENCLFSIFMGPGTIIASDRWIFIKKKVHNKSIDILYLLSKSSPGELMIGNLLSHWAKVKVHLIISWSFWNKNKCWLKPKVSGGALCKIIMYSFARCKIKSCTTCIKRNENECSLSTNVSCQTASTTWLSTISEWFSRYRNVHLTKFEEVALLNW